MKLIMLFFALFSVSSCSKKEIPTANLKCETQSVSTKVENISPSEKDIQEIWSKAHTSNEDIVELIGEEPLKLLLINREAAYLAKFSFPNRNIHSLAGQVLYMPSKNQICELSEIGVSNVEVEDFNGDGISELISEGFYLNMGESHSINTVFQLDGCDVKVLRQSDSVDNSGAYGEKSEKYYSNYFIWQFKNEDADHIKDLCETEIDSVGAEGADPILSMKRKCFIFKGFSYEEEKS